ncbi:MAG: tetratricopeptide repeat protein, partial [Treponema sp.]|nr:tetratricopeptide repeat protein [Candidatus Treponema equifaecale]
FFSCSKPGDLTVQQAMKAFQQQDYKKSLECFLQALEEESNYSDEIIYTFIANLYSAQDDLENAVVYQEKAVEIRPEYRAYVTLGRNYHLIENDEKALEFYEKAIQLDSQKGEAYASLGSLYITQKKYELALENLKKAAEFEPNIAVIHANLAVAYGLTGQKELAEAEFKKAEELKCENLEEFKARAYLE